MKQLLKKINQSASYADARDDIIALMTYCGMSERFLETEMNTKNPNYDYDIGMRISKAYDIHNTIPKMSWLPKEIKKLYK